MSWQRCDLQKTAECVTELREQYHKPVLVDEVGYEGNVTWGWGNLTAQEEVRRFWEGCLRGGYVTHGETYVDRGPKICGRTAASCTARAPSASPSARAFMESLPADMTSCRTTAVSAWAP